MLLNDGTFSIAGIVYAVIVTIIVFLLGVVIFNKTEKSFIDTV
jgi:lipopolysaccharide transport system permease protein